MMLLLNKANLSNRTASTLFFSLLIVDMDVALEYVIIYPCTHFRFFIYYRRSFSM